ncbi:hypothetical protein GCM10009741_48360 [Kribbella lupini]|uniref:AAA domain-containing protein n=2 Tax=Kribbella lupini TaxID=291602 RepID=A0ABN2BFE9_9ACTN
MTTPSSAPQADPAQEAVTPTGLGSAAPDAAPTESSSASFPPAAAPAESGTAESDSVDDAPVPPSPTDLTPADLTPADLTPADLSPTEPSSTEPIPADSVPAESASADPSSADPTPQESAPASAVDADNRPSMLQAAASSLGLGAAPATPAAGPVSRETAPAPTSDEEFPESPPPVDDYPLEPASHAGIRPQAPVDKAGESPAPTPTDILFGPRPVPLGMGAMTAAQIAARATSDELQRRLLETPIAAATERTLLVNEGRTMGREFPLPAETRVFVVANQKGGVGKTTTTVNVAAGLALYGARILVIDLDPQGNASTALGIEHSEGTPGVYEAIIENEPLSKLLQPCEEHPGIVVVPATIDLAGAEIELVSIVARESRLKKALDAHLAETEAAGEKYDYVFIDCPPSLGLLTVNALTAAREVLVPIQSEYYALEGLSQLLRHIEMVKSHLNPTLDVSTILLTMYDARTKLAGEVAAEVRGHFQDAVLRTAVPRSVRISEAPSHGQTVLAYDPASAGALSYLEASREIAMRNNA